MMVIIGRNNWISPLNLFRANFYLQKWEKDNVINFNTTASSRLLIVEDTNSRPTSTLFGEIKRVSAIDYFSIEREIQTRVKCARKGPVHARFSLIIGAHSQFNISANRVVKCPNINSWTIVERARRLDRLIRTISSRDNRLMCLSAINNELSLAIPFLTQCCFQEALYPSLLRFCNVG